MKWQNKVQLIGYMGLDPEIKELPRGGKVAIIRLATHTLFQKTKGEPSRTTAWNTVKLWGDRAERVATNFSRAVMSWRMAGWFTAIIPIKPDIPVSSRRSTTISYYIFTDNLPQQY
jgi:hypothetical protein